MPSVDAVRARFLNATGTAFPRTAALVSHPRLYQEMLDMEAVSERGPAGVPRYRRSQLLAWDRETASWEAWDTESGHRVHLVMGSWTPPSRPGVLAWASVGEGGARDGVWVSPPVELSLADLLPEVDDDALLCAQVLVAAVRALPDPFGTLGPSTVVRSAGRWTVSGVPGGDSGEGAGAVGRLAALFGLHGEALADLAEMPHVPVPTVERMLHAELADQLVAQIHRIHRRPAVALRERRAVAVRLLAERLAYAVRPPVGRGCLAAGADGTVALIEGDGDVIRGGLRGALPAAELGVLWRRGELDGHAVRPLLRLWSSRRAQDEDRRRDVQRSIGGDDGFVESTLNFLRVSAHLRVDRMLLLRGH